jgi:ACS family hexuronate transporter-like MFS transporter
MVVLLLFAASVLNYIDRAVLGVVKPLIQQDLSLNNEQYGYAVNAFLVTYTVFYILGGRLADRIGYRQMFSWSIAWWSIACALHSLTRGLASLCLFRGLLGIGEGCFYPTAIRGIARRFPPEERAKGIGIMLCGLTVGTLITPPALALVTHLWGWRSAFLFSGIAGFLLIPPWVMLHRHLAPSSDQAGEAQPGDGGASFLAALRHRKFLSFLLARAVTDVVWLFYLFWMPGYFQEVHGFNLEAVGKRLWIPFFCADLGALGGAWFTSGLVKRGWSVHRSRKSVLLVSATLGIAGVLAPFVAAPSLALAIVSLVLFAQFSWATNIHTTLTEITPQRHVAVLYGITGAAGNGLGALAQPALGRLVDQSGYTPAFVLTGVAYAAAILFVLAAGRIEPIERGVS